MKNFDEIRGYIDVDRKENRPENCVTTDLNEIPQRIKDMLKELPVMDTSTIRYDDGEGNELPIDLDSFSLFDSHFGSHQFWILKHKDKNYFVDTQGFDYARYCGCIKGEF